MNIESAAQALRDHRAGVEGAKLSAAMLLAAQAAANAVPQVAHLLRSAEATGAIFDGDKQWCRQFGAFAANNAALYPGTFARNLRGGKGPTTHGVIVARESSRTGALVFLRTIGQHSESDAEAARYAFAVAWAAVEAAANS